MDKNIEHELFQLQANYRLKLNDINQEIEQITENKIRSERLSVFLKSIEDNLNTQEENLNQISHQRQLDNQSTFDNLLELFQYIGQIQIELKESSKILNQVSNDSSVEELKIKLERLRSTANNEYINLNRLINEYKSYNQMLTNYNELNEQINDCIVNIVQYVDNRSRMLSPELEQHSPTDQLAQLNIYRIQIQEQLATVEHPNPVTSKFIIERIDQLQKDIMSLKDEVDSIFEKENETNSIQMRVDQLIEALQNEFDRQPTFSSVLTKDTFEIYEKLSNNYLQSIHNHLNELENTVADFNDVGLIRLYSTRLNQIQQQLVLVELNIENNKAHLQQGLVRQTNLQITMQKIIEDLNSCENQLINRISMKEHQLQQKLQVFLKKKMNT